MRSRARQISAVVLIKDSRGYLIRGALVYLRGVPERRLNAPAEKVTDKRGLVTMRLQPTKLLPLRAGGRLTIFVRARKPGEPVLAGASTRRLVSLRLGAPTRVAQKAHR